MDNAKLPVSFINNVDPAFGVPIAEDADGAVNQLYNSQDFPFDPEEYDVNGLHEFVAHFLCLTIKVRQTSFCRVNFCVASATTPRDPGIHSDCTAICHTCTLSYRHPAPLVCFCLCMCDVATSLRRQPVVSTALQLKLGKLLWGSGLPSANGSPLLRTACDLPNCF